MSDEWRVEVELGDEQHHLTLGERLRTLDLDDEARIRLGDRVIATRDGDHMFLYADSEAAAREAERVARDLLADEGLTGEIAVTRWHPVQEAWVDASVPLPSSGHEEQAEEHAHEDAEEREAAVEGEYDWEVRVDLPGLSETREMAKRLSAEGLDVKRRWSYLLIGAPTEERAAELGKRIEAEAPEGTEVHVEPAGGVRHPVFVFLGAHKPGIARDLGL
jgi:hypothetical protein